jgi:nitrogen regulatory protein PII
MKKVTYLVLCITLLSIQSNAQILKDLKKAAEDVIVETTKTGFTEEEAGKALKEALTIGIKKGVEQVSKPDGYFKDIQIKIKMPKKAKQVEDKLRMLGMDKMVDDAIESMNRAAEDAAIGAKDIFVDAIKELTLKDVMNIVNGEEDAATKYLKEHTKAQLVEKFKPVIAVSLEKVNATKYWDAVFTYYNKIPFVKKVNPDLEDHVTKKAINGLFVQIAKEELAIRKDPLARVTDLLKKVFG